MSSAARPLEPRHLDGEPIDGVQPVEGCHHAAEVELHVLVHQDIAKTGQPLQILAVGSGQVELAGRPTDRPGLVIERELATPGKLVSCDTEA